jgi:hypothetical protein
VVLGNYFGIEFQGILVVFVLETLSQAVLFFDEDEGGSFAFLARHAAHGSQAAENTGVIDSRGSVVAIALAFPVSRQPIFGVVVTGFG